MARRRKSTVRKPLGRTSKRPKLQASRSARVKKTKKPRYVYYFGDGHADGSGAMKSLLGGKGANLHEMTRIGLPVPPGFTITTEGCTHFYGHNRTYPREVEAGGAAGPAESRKFGREKIWRRRATFARVRAIGRTRFHARNDGHHPEPRDE